MSTTGSYWNKAMESFQSIIEHLETCTKEGCKICFRARGLLRLYDYIDD